MRRNTYRPVSRNSRYRKKQIIKARIKLACMTAAATLDGMYFSAAETAETAADPDTYPIEMNITSKYAVVYDVTTNTVLYAKNADEKCYPASTTKLMTAALALDYVDEDFVFTAGQTLLSSDNPWHTVLFSAYP